MAKGNEIIVAPTDAKGRFIEGVVNTGETFYPGMAVQYDPTQTTVGGRFVHKLYNRDVDGDIPTGPWVIVLPNHLMGKTALDSYAAGERFFGYTPVQGDELNLYLADVEGTADSHSAGEMLIVDDGTGAWIASTGTAESDGSVPAKLLETIVPVAGANLAHCVWSGY